MSNQTQSRILLAMGILGLLGTIGVQVFSVGDLKGRIETVIQRNDETLKFHETELRGHALGIERLNGRMGLSSSSSFQRWKEAEPPAQQQ